MSSRLAPTLAALALLLGSAWILTTGDAPAPEAPGGRQARGAAAASEREKSAIDLAAPAVRTAAAPKAEAGAETEVPALPSTRVATKVTQSVSAGAEGPHGALRITWDDATDGAGRPLTPDFIVVTRTAGGPTGQLLRVHVEPGTSEVLLTEVGLRLGLFVTTSSARVPGELGVLKARGPSAAGETVDLHVPLLPRARDLVAVRARLVDGTSAPHPSSDVTLSFRPPKTKKQFAAMRVTDGAGGVALEVPRFFLERPIHLDLWRDTTRIQTDVEPPVLEPRERRVDLGEIVLEVPEPPPPAAPHEPPAPVVVSGRVLAQGGQTFRKGRAHVSLLHAHGAEPRPEYVVVKNVSTDEKGRFSLEWQPASSIGALRVRAWSADATEDATVDTLPGTRDLEIVLRRGTLVSARILADPWTGIYLRGSATLVGEGLDATPAVAIGNDGIGGILQRGCPPGSGRLKVKLGSGDWILFDTAVSTYDDLDLGIVDLRDAFRVCHLRLIAEDGGPVGPSVKVRAARNGMLIHSALVAANGNVDFLVPTAVGDLELVTQAGRGRASAGVFTVPVSGQETPRFDVQLGP